MWRREARAERHRRWAFVRRCPMSAPVPTPGALPREFRKSLRMESSRPWQTICRQAKPTPGSAVMGVADVAFMGHTLYAITAGAGCSHGLAGTDNGVLRVNPNGATSMVADLSVFQKRKPVANPNPDDFEPDGTWYSMIAVRGTFYAIEPNHGELDAISIGGHVRRIADISNVQGHIVPTALAYDDHDFYVGNLDTFP